MSNDCDANGDFLRNPLPDGHDKIAYFTHMSRSMSLSTIEALLKSLGGDVTESAHTEVHAHIEARNLARRMVCATDQFAVTLLHAAD